MFGGISTKKHFLAKKLENIWQNQEKAVTLQQSCKNDIRQRKLRHRYGENFS